MSLTDDELDILDREGFLNPRRQVDHTKFALACVPVVAADTHIARTSVEGQQVGIADFRIAQEVLKLDEDSVTRGFVKLVHHAWGITPTNNNIQTLLNGRGLLLCATYVTHKGHVWPGRFVSNDPKTLIKFLVETGQTALYKHLLRLSKIYSLATDRVPDPMLRAAVEALHLPEMIEWMKTKLPGLDDGEDEPPAALPQPAAPQGPPPTTPAAAEPPRQGRSRRQTRRQ